MIEFHDFKPLKLYRNSESAQNRVWVAMPNVFDLSFTAEKPKFNVRLSFVYVRQINDLENYDFLRRAYLDSFNFEIAVGSVEPGQRYLRFMGWVKKHDGHNALARIEIGMRPNVIGYDPEIVWA